MKPINEMTAAERWDRHISYQHEYGKKYRNRSEIKKKLNAYARNYYLTVTKPKRKKMVSLTVK